MENLFPVISRNCDPLPKFFNWTRIPKVNQTFLVQTQRAGAGTARGRSQIASMRDDTKTNGHSVEKFQIRHRPQTSSLECYDRFNLRFPLPIRRMPAAKPESNPPDHVELNRRGQPCLEVTTTPGIRGRGTNRRWRLSAICPQTSNMTKRAEPRWGTCCVWHVRPVARRHSHRQGEANVRRHWAMGHAVHARPRVRAPWDC